MAWYDLGIISLYQFIIDRITFNRFFSVFRLNYLANGLTNYYTCWINYVYHFFFVSSNYVYSLRG